MTLEKMPLHVIDSQSSRRARIAFDLGQANATPQIYENVEEFLQWSPDKGILLLDEKTGGKSISEIIRSTTSAGTCIPIAVYDEEPSTLLVVKAMLAGAVDYLEWPFDQQKLEEAIKKIGQDLPKLAQSVNKRNEAKSAVDALSAREFETLKGVVDGLSNKEIAIRMGISPRTVEIHRANMLTKLNAKSTSDAVRIGIYAGLDEIG